MKKNLIYLIILAVLAVVAYYAINSRSGSTLDKELSDFAVKDTGAVVKIFMADKGGQSVLLEKQENNEWTVNTSFEARPDAIQNLLTTIAMVDVRSPVAKAAFNNVMKQLAAKAIKVEVYSAAGLVKTYYVGGPTQDQLGTFMYLEGSDVPFVTQIPGFEGYLTPRYNVKEKEWRTKRVFRLTPEQIVAVKAVDFSIPDMNVQLEKADDGSFKVLNGDGQVLDGVSQDKVINYLGFYSQVNYEMEENTLSKSQEDSLLVTAPVRKLTVSTVEGTTQTITMWRRPITDATTFKQNAGGKVFPFDVDRMVARVNEDPGLLVVQYYSFDRLFRRPTDFLAR